MQTRKALLATVLSAAMLLPMTANADPHEGGGSSNFAFGIMLGEPTALSFKNWVGSSHAWDLAIGVGPGVRVHADYLFTLAQLIRNQSSYNLDLYLGVGPLVGTYTGWCGRLYDPGYGCGEGGLYGGGRVPIGLDLRLMPIDLGIEFAPAVIAARPGVAFLLDAALFFRILL